MSLIVPILLSLFVMIFSANLAAFEMPDLPKGITYHHDISVGMIDGVELKIDIAAPTRVKGKRLPVLVAIHGGGWRKGNKDKFAKTIVGYAKRNMVGVSIMYRFAPEYIFPAQIEDTKAAIRFLKANAETYGINSDQIIVRGNSAGGHLAAMLGVTGNDTSFKKRGLWPNENSKVFAVVDYAGPTAGFLSKESNRWKSLTLFLGGPSLTVPEIAKAAMPISYVDKDDPPFFVVHGDSDDSVPVEASREFVRALSLAGVRHEYTEIVGGEHKLSQSNPDEYRASKTAMKKFIADLLSMAKK